MQNEIDYIIKKYKIKDLEEFRVFENKLNLKLSEQNTILETLETKKSKLEKKLSAEEKELEHMKS